MRATERFTFSKAQPFPVELMVFEEDTHRLLSAGNSVREERRSNDDILRAAEEYQPSEPGDLVVRGNQAYAIIHDLDQSPSWQIHWIECALERLATLCASRSIMAVGMQPLGCVHGDFTLEALEHCLVRTLSLSDVERWWIRL